MGEFGIDEVCNMHARGLKDKKAGAPHSATAAPPLRCMSRVRRRRTDISAY